MKVLIDLSCFVLAIVVMCTSTSAQITYDVLPVTLSDGYAIDGGFITTTGIGTLSASDITDYRIEVSGAVPYVFSPSNPLPPNPIDVRGTLQATATDLFLPVSGSGLNALFIAASDITAGVNCDLCQQKIDWSNSPTSNESFIRYEHTDTLDFDPTVSATHITSPQSVLTIARVPEPSSFGLIAWVVLGGVSAGRRCRI